MITKYQDQRDDRFFIIEYNESENIYDVQQQILREGFLITEWLSIAKIIKAIKIHTVAINLEDNNKNE